MNTTNNTAMLRRPDISTMVDAWNRGDEIRIISMGGMGIPYERCIWTLVMAILVDEVETKLPPLPTDGEPPVRTPEFDEFWDAFGRTSLKRVDAPGLPTHRLSGGQVGAAKNVACVILRLGVEEAFATVPEERIVDLSRGSFPTV
jgi:hypothetical protein